MVIEEEARVTTDNIGRSDGSDNDPVKEQALFDIYNNQNQGSYGVQRISINQHEGKKAASSS